jgi:hypothetical protein
MRGSRRVTWPPVHRREIRPGSPAPKLDDGDKNFVGIDDTGSLSNGGGWVCYCGGGLLLVVDLLGGVFRDVLAAKDRGKCPC